jgi:hypothetical protein
MKIVVAVAVAVAPLHYLSLTETGSDLIGCVRLWCWLADVFNNSCLTGKKASASGGHVMSRLADRAEDVWPLLTWRTCLMSVKKN